MSVLRLAHSIISLANRLSQGPWLSLRVRGMQGERETQTNKQTTQTETHTERIG